MNKQKFLAFQQLVIEQLNADIDSLLAAANLPSPLKEACEYTMTANGKRVRPLLVANTFASFCHNQNGGKDQSPLPVTVRRAMLAVEFLHTYSLIHDDLPCMDDDDLRRGQATCHVKFGEATALLAGDILQSLAFEALVTDSKTFCNEVNTVNLTNSESLIPSTKLLQIFAPRARRMVSGQTLDIEGENKKLSAKELKSIHEDKTGALIEASVLMGLATVSSEDTNADMFEVLEKFAKYLGLAFQVQDDVLDATADTDQLGKPAGSDEKLNKSTYVKLMGVVEANEYAGELFKQAKTHLEILGSGCYLEKFADVLWHRKK